MMFNELKTGDNVYIVEVLGTFKKNTSYSVGTVSSVSNVYDEALPQGQFQMPGQTRKRLVDVVITSDGESKKFTVPVDRSIISDSSIGLTISTNKNEIVKIIQDQYNIYKAKKDSIAKCDEEMKRCQDLLDKLDIKPEEKEDPRIKELQNEVSELKNIIKQASQMVPAPMKQMLPQDMQNAMNEASLNDQPFLLPISLPLKKSYYTMCAIVYPIAESA